MSSLDFWNALVGGVDHALPGNGGQVCADHVTSTWRTWELIAAMVPVSAAMLLSIKLRGRKEGLPENVPNTRFHNFLLILTVFVYGLQFGYKLSTRQVIFLLNPCHVITVICIYLLASDPSHPSSWSRFVHTRSIHFLLGPLLALIFPVTNTLFLPLEAATYWVQHGLDIFVPLYLLLCHSGFQPTARALLRPGDILLSYSLWVFYHFAVMMPVSVYSLANVGSMLCPAITDPFPPSLYRMHGLWHQMLGVLVCAVMAKLLVLVFSGMFENKKRK